MTGRATNSSMSNSSGGLVHHGQQHHLHHQHHVVNHHPRTNNYTVWMIVMGGIWILSSQWLMWEYIDTMLLGSTNATTLTTTTTPLYSITEEDCSSQQQQQQQRQQQYQEDYRNGDVINTDTIVLRPIVAAATNDVKNRGTNENFKTVQQPRDDEVVCDGPPNEHKPALDTIQIATETQLQQAQTQQQLSRKPRILCYILSVDAYHDTKVKAVLDTWGPKCTGFFVASNATDPSINAYEIPRTRHSWRFLWEKHRETLRFFRARRLLDQYDWFFKADDDTYVIVENLYHLLMTRPDILDAWTDDRRRDGSHRPPRPLQIGYHGFKVQNPLNVIPSFLRELWLMSMDLDADRPPAPDARGDPNQRMWLFAYGGAGFAMNRRFVENVVTVLDTPLCYNREVDLHKPEDSSLSFCHNILFGGETVDTRTYRRDGTLEAISRSKKPPVLYNTTDRYGREMFLPKPPAKAWKECQSYKINCPARHAVSFHHIDPALMRYIHHQLYTCRQPQSQQPQSQPQQQPQQQISGQGPVQDNIKQQE